MTHTTHIEQAQMYQVGNKYNYIQFPGYNPLVIDIDECASMDTNNCAADATCDNTPAGSFTCTCNSGYTGDGLTCTGEYHVNITMQYSSPVQFISSSPGLLPHHHKHLP